MATTDDLDKRYYTKGLTYTRSEIAALLTTAPSGDLGPIPSPTYDPGVVAAGKSYSLNPGNTYTHLLDNTGTAITIPSPAGGHAIFNARAFYNGTYWAPSWLDINLTFANNKIMPWSPGPYNTGDQANTGGKDWTANAAVTSADIPGVSSKWDERLSGYNVDTIKKLTNTDAQTKAANFVSTQPGYVDATGYHANASYATELYKLKNISSFRVLGATDGNLYVAAIYNSTTISPANLVTVLKSQTAGTTVTPVDLTYTVANDSYYLVLSRTTGSAIDLQSWVVNVLGKDILSQTVSNNATDLGTMSPLKSLYLSDAALKAANLNSTLPGYLDATGYHASAPYITEVYSLKNIGSVRASGSTKGGISIISIYNSTNIVIGNLVALLLSGPNGTTTTTVDVTYKVTNDNWYFVVCREVVSAIDLVQWKPNVLVKDVSSANITQNTSDIGALQVITTDLPQSPSSTTAAAYMQYDTNALTQQSAPGSTYSIEFYPVTVGDFYNLTGFVRGLKIAVWAFLSDVVVDTAHMVQVGQVYNENTTGANINVNVQAPAGAAYLAITKLVIFSKVTLAVKHLSTINSKISGIQAQVAALSPSVNQAWLAMDTLNKKVERQYPHHFIDVQAGVNNRYDFGNMKVTANFIVPAVGSSVNLTLSNVSLLTVGKKICVGTKTYFDVYAVTAINTLTVSCTLLTNLTNRVGTTINYQTGFTNVGLTVNDQISVYTYDDLYAYLSNEFPSSAMRSDNLHPADPTYAIIGQVIASRINVRFGKPVRIFCEGDSFTSEAKYTLQLASILGSTIVNHGQFGARVEHILSRFLSFMATYTVTPGDFFLFYMGTNNLADIVRLAADPQSMFYNNSYTNIFLDAVEQISAALPLGNWMVCSGHGNALYYKENV